MSPQLAVYRIQCLALRSTHVEAEIVFAEKTDAAIVASPIRGGNTCLEEGAVQDPKGKGKGGTIPHPGVSHPIRDQAAAQTFAKTSTTKDARPGSATVRRGRSTHAAIRYPDTDLAWHGATARDSALTTRSCGVVDGSSGCERMQMGRKEMVESTTAAVGLRGDDR